MPPPDASVSMVKVCLKSGNLNTGADMSVCLRLSNAVTVASVHLNAFSFLRNFVGGATIFS